MLHVLLILVVTSFFNVGFIYSDLKVCETDICKHFVNELKASMNESADPCEDFSSYICGNFAKAHPIPSGSSSVNSFSEINDKVTVTLKELLENQAIDDVKVPQSKAAIYYKSCLDTNKRNLNSKKTILETISQLESITIFEDALVALVKKGITSRILSFETAPDAKNPKYFQFTIGIPKLVISESTLKSPEDQNSKKQIMSLTKFMKQVLSLLGTWKTDKSAVEDIIELNIKLAQTIPSVADQHDPDKYYNKVSIAKLQTLCPNIKWLYLINGILNGTGKSLNETNEIIVSSLPYINNMCLVLKIYQSNPKLSKILHNDLVWAEINSILSLGSDDLIEALDKLNEEILGISGKEQLWKTCVQLTSDTFSNIVGNMYVKKAFDTSKKKDIEDMVTNIRNALKEVIENVRWMDDVTKEKALTKLKTITQKIGYPDSILNETKLSLDHNEIHIGLDSLIENHYAVKKIEFKNSLKLMNEKIPDDLWFLGPHQVNAYYNPSSNEIVFPAAILQYPFYDFGLPVTSNYGGIGMVIGHEILHGFDTAGSKFDEMGVLRNWWTNTTKEKYMKKAKCIENQYGKYSIYEEKLPSLQTLSEDLADNAGLRMSYLASQNSTKEKTVLPVLAFTPEQLFFVHFARSWCAHVTKAALLERMKQDVHTVWSYRINGALSNMPGFSKAFRCTHNQKMNRNKKCLVW